MGKKILVTILMTTYNHEKFVDKAIKSVVNQKTNFSFELIIGEDCSTDKTLEICNNYAKKFPEIIKLYNSKENIGSGKNFKKIFFKSKGEYIAICEGDDYWTDPLKLQKQLSFLEENKKYSLSFCRFKTLNEINGNLKVDNNGHYFLNEKGSVAFDFKIFSQGWQIGTQTMVFRKKMFDKTIFSKYKNIKDIHIISHLLNEGKGLCLNFFGAVYRLHLGGIYAGASTLENASTAYYSYKEIYKNNNKNKYLKRKYDYFTKSYFNILLDEKQYKKVIVFSLKKMINDDDFQYIKILLNLLKRKSSSFLSK